MSKYMVEVRICNEDTALSLSPAQDFERGGRVVYTCRWWMDGWMRTPQGEKYVDKEISHCYLDRLVGLLMLWGAVATQIDQPIGPGLHLDCTDIDVHAAIVLFDSMKDCE